MNKKRLVVFYTLLLVALCAVVLAGCSRTQIVDLSDYMKNGENGVDNLNPIGKLIKAMHGWIGSYGWTVVVFTVFLKIVMLPFDLWQRVSMKKSSLKMQELQPILESIDKRYGSNTQKANEEKSKIYRKQSVSMFASCLPMILTMVIFFTVFSGLTSYSTYNNVTNYNSLRTFYYAQYDEVKQAAVADGKTEDEATDLAVRIASEGGEYDGVTYDGVGAYYVSDVRESFLWIANIWQPDTWETIMPTYGSFSATVTIGGKNPADEYNLIREQVLKTHTRNTEGKWNGLMILPIASVGLSFLSIFLSQRLERKNKKGETVEQTGQQAATNKVMMFLMPAMMAFFGFRYTGAFAIYMVTNYSLSILSTVLLRVPAEKIAIKRIEENNRKNNVPKATYKR